MSDFDSSQQPWKLAVIGGGMSGLAAAHRAVELSQQHNQQSRVILFEANAQCGGIVGTKTIAGYRAETGADSFITNKPWALELCKRLGLEDQLIETDASYRRSQVLHRGRPCPVPEGFMLLSPVKIGPVLRSPIFTPAGKLRMAAEYFLPAKKRSDNDESLASFVRRRFGNEALERIVQPMVGGIYTADPEKLSLWATMPRFLEMEQKYGSVIRGLRQQTHTTAEQQASGARYGMFLSLREGISQLADRLATQVAQHAEVRCNTSVTSLAYDGSQQVWSIQSADGNIEYAESVIVALRAYQAADLIDPLNADLAGELRKIEYASSAIVVSGHKLTDIDDPLDAFGLVIPHIENRKILAVSYTSRKFANRAPDGCVQLRTFVGGAMQGELLQQTDDEIIAMVRREHEQILGLRGEADFTLVQRYDRAMPQYHVGHESLVAGIERAAGQLPGFKLAGNAYRGVGLPDTIHSGEQAAEALFGELADVSAS